MSTQPGDEHEYDIRPEEKYGSLTLIDLPADIAAHEPWFNQTLTTVTSTMTRTNSSSSSTASSSSTSRTATRSSSITTRATPFPEVSCTAHALRCAPPSSWSRPPASYRPGTDCQVGRCRFCAVYSSAPYRAKEHSARPPSRPHAADKTCVLHSVLSEAVAGDGRC